MILFVFVFFVNYTKNSVAFFNEGGKICIAGHYRFGVLLGFKEIINVTNMDDLSLQNNNLINSDTAYPADFITWLDEKNSDWRNQVSPSYCSLLQFSAANYNVNEGDVSVTITVTRSENKQGAVSVDYATSDDSATAGSDYTQTTGTLNWTYGDDADKTFPINIIDDSQPESNETLIVSVGT
ncbi:MAG: Calx-beta domain-containing protein [Pseudomonadota bacterium]